MSEDFDITHLANADGKQDIIGGLTILARTRMELDGDLLVVLPTTKTVASSSSNPPGQTTAGGKNDPTTTADIKENEPIFINNEVLKLHTENVNMAIHNLQFVYEKVMDIASKFAVSTRPNSIIRFFRK